MADIGRTPEARSVDLQGEPITLAFKLYPGKE